MWQIELLYVSSRDEAYNKAFKSTLWNYNNWRLPTESEIKTIYTKIVGYE